MMQSVGLEQTRLSGMFLEPLSGQWSLTGDTAVNYIASFRKRRLTPEGQLADNSLPENA